MQEDMNPQQVEETTVEKRDSLMSTCIFQALACLVVIGGVMLAAHFNDDFRQTLLSGIEYFRSINFSFDDVKNVFSFFNGQF